MLEAGGDDMHSPLGAIDHRLIEARALSRSVSGKVRVGLVPFPAVQALPLQQHSSAMRVTPQDGDRSNRCAARPLRPRRSDSRGHVQLWLTSALAAMSLGSRMDDTAATSRRTTLTVPFVCAAYNFLAMPSGKLG